MNKKTNFGIIVTVTVMMGAMVLSSCSHEDYFYSEEKAEQTINDKYAAAFEKAFGKVGPNVDWGFSSKNSSTRAFTRSGVAFNTTITFPGDCNASNFLKAVPEGAKKLPADGGGARSWSTIRSCLSAREVTSLTSTAYLPTMYEVNSRITSGGSNHIIYIN